MNCKHDADRDAESISSAAKSTYGKVSQSAFLEALKDANIKIGEIRQRDLETFREDYAIGICADGSFEVSYRGRCDTCGSEYKYRFVEPMAVNPEAASAGGVQLRNR